MLPRMYLDNDTSQEYTIISIISSRSSGISLLNKFSPEHKQQAVWQYNYDGHWHDIDRIPEEMTVQLSATSKIRYSKRSNGVLQYGFHMFYYFEESSALKVGQAAQPGSGVLKKAFLLVHPVPIVTQFSANDLKYTYTLYEDQYFNQGIQLNEFFYTTTPIKFVEDPVPKEYHDSIPSEEMKIFHQDVEQYEHSRPVAVIKTDISSAGNLEIVVQTEQGPLLVPPKKHGLPLDFENSILMFRPHLNYYGNINVSLEICNCFSTVGDVTSKMLSLNIDVIPINDPPIFTSRVAQLPPIPFEITDENGNRFSINQLINETKTYDPEKGTDIGIAVYKLPTTNKLGQWQYKNDNDVWTDIVVNNTVDPFKTNAKDMDSNTFVNAHHFDKDQTIRFNLYDDTVLWKSSEGRYGSFLGFSYWDKSNGLAPGM